MQPDSGRRRCDVVVDDDDGEVGGGGGTMTVLTLRKLFAWSKERVIPCALSLAAAVA